MRRDLAVPPVVEIPADELGELRVNAERWTYYAGRVAALMGISIEEMAREIDDAIAAESIDSMIRH